MNSTTLINSLINRPFVYGWELRNSINQFAQQLNQKVSHRPVSISWEMIATAAITGDGKLILASVADDAKISRAVFVRYVGYVIHEILHWAYTDFSAKVDAPYIARLHNAVEDIWIERRGIREGLTGNIEGVLSDLVNQMVDEAVAQVQDWADPAQYPFVLAVWGRRYAKKVPLANGLEPIFTEASARIDSCANSHDTLEVARWVYSQLKTVKPPKSEQKPEQSDQPGNKGQPDVGDARPVKNQNQDSADVEPNLGDQRVEPQPGMALNEVRGPDYLVMPSPHMDVSITVPARLRFEVRRLFDNSGMTLFTPGRKTGSVHVASLHKATITDRVFQRRQDIEGIDSSVCIALDCSGSMTNLLEDAVKATYALVDALASADVPCGLVTFATNAAVTLPVQNNRAKFRNILSRLVCGGGTNDSLGLRLAMDQLLPRQEQRRVIFVVTDGRGRVNDVKALARSAVNLGITVIGVGIGIDVSDVYPQSITIKSVKELGAVMFDQIKIAA